MGRKSHDRAHKNNVFISAKNYNNIQFAVDKRSPSAYMMRIAIVDRMITEFANCVYE